MQFRIHCISVKISGFASSPFRSAMSLILWRNLVVEMWLEWRSSLSLATLEMASPTLSTTSCLGVKTCSTHPSLPAPARWECGLHMIPTSVWLPLILRDFWGLQPVRIRECDFCLRYWLDAGWLNRSVTVIDAKFPSSLSFQVLAVSDIVIYRTRAERLHNDMFIFLSSASGAYLKHFTPELRALSSRCGLDVPLSSLGPAVIVFQETTHTQLLGHGR